MGHFTSRDDLLHDISDSPHARESLLWTAPVPEAGLLAFAYAWVDAGGRFGRLVCVSGDDPYAPLFLDYAEDLELDGENLDECSIGGLRLRQPDPLRSAEIAYETEGFSYSCRFEGMHEPFSWHQNRGGCPTWAATDRFEQSCRTSGEIVVGGRRVEFSSTGHRDHSWGTRDWRVLQHWKWINAASNGDSLHAFVSFALGERQVLGYLNRGGVVSPILDAEVTATLDERMVHRTVTARFVDEGGRSMALETQSVAGWQMPIRHLLLNEMGGTATIDGRPGVAHVEFGWPADYVRDLTEG
jgi:hypothetical protein